MGTNPSLAITVERIYRTYFSDQVKLLERLAEERFFPWGISTGCTTLISEDALRGESEGHALLLDFDLITGHCRSYVLFEMKRLGHMRVDFMTDAAPNELPRERVWDLTTYLATLEKNHPTSMVSTVKRAMRELGQKEIPVGNILRQSGGAKADVLRALEVLKRDGDVLENRPGYYTLNG